MLYHAVRITVAFSLSVCTILSHTTPVTLESPLIHYVDGIFINGRRICDIRKLQLEIGFLAVGKKNKDGIREPLYIFHIIEHDDHSVYVICSDGSKVELHDITHAHNQSKSAAVYDSTTLYECASLFSGRLYRIIYDSELSTCYADTAIELNNNAYIASLFATTTPRHSLHSLMLLEQDLIPDGNDMHYRTIMRTALHIMLNFMKHDFEKKSSKFIEDATLFKKAMVELIQESCNKRGREDSLLLGWAKSEKGHEMEHFSYHVLNFKDFYVFSSDLIGFLSDLMHSCPKAMKQFKELMDQTQEKA